MAAGGTSALVGSPNANNSAGAASVYVGVSPHPVLGLSKYRGGPYQAVGAGGATFGAGEAVKLYWDGTATTPLTATYASITGTLLARVTVPPAALGLHSLIAVGQSSGVTATAPFTVTPALYLAPTTGKAGSTVHVYGLGFGSKETVAALWYPGAKLLGTGPASALGSVALTVTVPLSATGAYAVLGYGLTSKQHAAAPYTVTP